MQVLHFMEVGLGRNSPKRQSEKEHCHAQRVWPRPRQREHRTGKVEFRARWFRHQNVERISPKTATGRGCTGTTRGTRSGQETVKVWRRVWRKKFRKNLRPSSYSHLSIESVHVAIRALTGLKLRFCDSLVRVSHVFHPLKMVSGERKKFKVLFSLGLIDRVIKI